uniref:Uncharacterized protein n=1 Tax=Globisporangium ultimum (strain ATCC 200006 / CBS 805.95 / DAOM BR144) TaxID=431595 RepID=K3WS69_GLOUD
MAQLAFLQSSPESPGILLLFQKLFNSPLETNWSPGDVLLDMQKSCHSKNLSDAVVKFITYVALFYYNFGNYDLITGAKIVPELTRHEFKEVVQCTRAFTQNRGSGVQSLLDDVLDAIYSQNNSATQPHGRAPDLSDHGSNLRTGMAQEFGRSYPFYGYGVAMDDAIGVDRVLTEHQIPLLNTRIALRCQDASMNTHTKVFLVRQTALDSCPDGDIADMKSAFVEKLRMAVPPVRAFHLRNRNQINFSKGDHHAILSEIQAELLAASTPVTPEEGSSTHSKISNQQDQLVHHLIMFFERGDVASQDAAVQLWRHGDDCAAFFIGIFPLPPARDPLHRRGAVESFLAIRNAFFHSRTQKLLRPELLSELVCALPFHELMQPENRATSVSVECLDVIVTGRCASLLTSLQPRTRCDMFDEDEDASKSNFMKPPRAKVLFLANCMTHFAHGLATPEKTVLLSGFISDTIQAIVGDERERVRYLQFLCEDVLSLCTTK